MFYVHRVFIEQTHEQCSMFIQCSLNRRMSAGTALFFEDYFQLDIRVPTFMFILWLGWCFPTWLIPSCEKIHLVNYLYLVPNPIYLPICNFFALDNLLGQHLCPTYTHKLGKVSFFFFTLSSICVGAKMLVLMSMMITCL